MEPVHRHVIDTNILLASTDISAYPVAIRQFRRGGPFGMLDVSNDPPGEKFLHLNMKRLSFSLHYLLAGQVCPTVKIVDETDTVLILSIK